MRKLTSLTFRVLSTASVVALAAGCEARASQSSLTSADSVTGQHAGSEADSTAIMNALGRWEQGWEEYDADLAAADYATSADFTNAFGMRSVGRDSIRALLARVFQVRTVTAGTTRYEYHDLKFVSPEVALLRSRAMRDGQQLADGTPEVRRINHLRVFARTADGWQIVSHLISDERTPGEAR